MSYTRRKSSLARTILSAEDEILKNEQEPASVDELDESVPEELEADDLEFLEENQEEKVGEESDPTLNIEDIVACSDEDGKVKMSSIRALAEETIIPDDKDEDEIVGSRKADINAPGIEDTIGDEAHGGKPSVSNLFDKESVMDEEDQEKSIKEITARLDKIASYCERSGHKRLAYEIDQISDKLEEENL